MKGDEMQLGEIGRALERLEEGQRAHGDKLDEIKEQTLKTNGAIGRHEVRLNVLDREMRDLKRERHAAPTPPALPSIPVSTNEGESIQIKISNKIWVAIVAAVMAVWPMIVDWIQEWWKRP